MKAIIEGHVVVINKMSIYIDGKMEFQAVNLISEYGQMLNGCKYAVASRYSRERLEEMYAENLKKFSPFIYLTEDEYRPIRESNNNDSKFHQREINCHVGYEYQEEISESGHRCVSLLADPEPDPLTAIIEREEETLRRRQIAALPEALATLTEKQRKRIIMHFFDGMTFRAIAEVEGVKEASVDESIQEAKKRMAIILKKENNFSKNTLSSPNSISH